MAWWDFWKDLSQLTWFKYNESRSIEITHLLRAYDCLPGRSMILIQLQYFLPVLDRRSVFLKQLVQPWFFFFHWSKYTFGTGNLSTDKIFYGLSKTSGLRDACTAHKEVSSLATSAIPAQMAWLRFRSEYTVSNGVGIFCLQALINSHCGAFVAISQCFSHSPQRSRAVANIRSAKSTVSRPFPPNSASSTKTLKLFRGFLLSTVRRIRLLLQAGGTKSW